MCRCLEVGKQDKIRCNRSRHVVSYGVQKLSETLVTGAEAKQARAMLSAGDLIATLESCACPILTFNHQAETKHTTKPPRTPPNTPKTSILHPPHLLSHKSQGERLSLSPAPPSPRLITHFGLRRASCFVHISPTSRVHTDSQSTERTIIMSGWGLGWFGGGQAKKEAPKKAILQLRGQLEMLNKREKHLQNQMDEQDALARKHVSSNKAGMPARICFTVLSGKHHTDA